MDNRVTTTSNSIAGRSLSASNSGSVLQNAAVTPWQSVVPHVTNSISSKNEALPISYSRPILTVDPLNFKSDPASRAVSFVIHCAIITLVLAVTLRVHAGMKPALNTVVTPLNFTLYAPRPVTMQTAKAAGGGGGGGAQHVVEPVRGKAPVVVARVEVLLPPQISRIERPKLGIEPTVQIKIPDSSNLPKIGMSVSPQIALASQGRGGGSGFGQGLGGGIGSGRSASSGPGSGGGYGGGLMSVGGGVAAPQLIHSVEPDFSEQARRANLQGEVSIKLIVDSQGNPQDIRLERSLGMGLDEKAIAAVRQYRFRPAMYQGHPVAVQIVIEVAFHLH